jgi:hypothetical protein
VKIFLSYSRDDFDLADSLSVGLRNEGHEVFFDSDDLRAGDAYHANIRAGIAAADLFIFLVSPSSVRPNHYAMTELGFAREQWPAPAGHVLPVMVKPTDLAAVPAYLRSVNLLQEGDVVAATLNRVAEIEKVRNAARRRRRRLPLAATGAALAVLGIAGYFMRPKQPSMACSLTARVEPTQGAAGMALDTDYEGNTNSFLVTEGGVASIQVGPLKAANARWTVKLASAAGIPMGSQPVTGCPAAPLVISIAGGIRVTLTPRY